MHISLQTYYTCQTISSLSCCLSAHFHIVLLFFSVPMTNLGKRVECRSTAVCPLPMPLVKLLRHRGADKGEKEKYSIVKHWWGWGMKRCLKREETTVWQSCRQWAQLGNPLKLLAVTVSSPYKKAHCPEWLKDMGNVVNQSSIINVLWAVMVRAPTVSWTLVITNVCLCVCACFCTFVSFFFMCLSSYCFFSSFFFIWVYNLLITSRPRHLVLTGSDRKGTAFPLALWSWGLCVPKLWLDL